MSTQDASADSSTAAESTAPEYDTNGSALSAKVPESVANELKQEAEEANLPLSRYVYRLIQDSRGREIEESGHDPNAPKNSAGLTTDAVDPDGNEPGEFWCPECGARVTRGATLLEYGHRAGTNPDKNDGERCSRRPSEVDSRDPRKKAAYSMHESMGIGRFAEGDLEVGETP